MTTALTPFLRSENAGARLMASAWAGYLEALWRGDSAASAFAEWLAHYWESSLERPPGTPDARTIHAAGSRGIEWYQRDGWVSGHVAGGEGGYLLPLATILAHPWLTAATLAA